MRLPWPRKRKEKRLRTSPSCGGAGGSFGLLVPAFRSVPRSISCNRSGLRKQEADTYGGR